MTGINVLPVVLWYDREILVASIDAHHILHSVSVRSGQCSKPMPIRHDINLHELVHKSGQLNVIFEDAWRVLKRVVIVVGPIFLFEFLQEVSKSQVDTLRPIGEVSESIVCLSLGVDYLISCHFHQISLVLPKVVCILALAIASKYARSVQLYVVVVEAFRCHRGVVTLGNFVVVRQVLHSTVSRQKVMEIIVPQFSPNPYV